MKVIIMDYEPYSERRGNHFFMNIFRDQGIEVEFWSLSKVLPYAQNLVFSYKEDSQGVFYINTIAELKYKLKELDHVNTFVFTEFLFNHGTLFVFKLLKHHSLKWGRLRYYFNPVHNFYGNSRKVKTESLLRWITKIFRKSLSFDYQRFHFYQRFRKDYFKTLITSDVDFITGENQSYLINSKKCISIDFFDVENYNTEIQNEPIVRKPYIVFLDAYLGKHPDLQIINPKQYMDVDAYYERMKKFFSFLEDKLKMPVIVAMHPKASYDKEFGDRQCIKNQTSNLIINSDLVIQHCSLSVSFALLSGKKIIQLYDNEFLDNPVLFNFYEVMQEVTLQTDSFCINIEEEFDLEKIYGHIPDIERYNAILQRYFRKNKADKRSNFEIIHEEIRNIMGT